MTAKNDDVGNVAIQFSGGRTSAYMLRKQLDRYGGTLPNGWKVCFENTGKEREETLVFIREVEKRWQVPVVWIEFDDYFDPAEYIKDNGELRPRKLRRGVRYKIVNFDSASRQGEPFTKLLDMLAQYRDFVKDAPPVLPNVVQRICTAYLKRKTCRTYLQDCGWDDWDIYMGIRVDEAHRRTKMQEWLPNNEFLQCPLIVEGITKEDVNRYWQSSPFDLKLDRNSDEGNCDLCFMKATGKLIKIMQADRSREKYWIGLEQKYKANFSKSKPTFQQLAVMIDANDPKLQKYLNNLADKTIDCFCGE